MADALRAEIGGVRLSADGIMPVGGNLAMLVRSAEVVDVTLRYGFRSANPLVQVVFGLGLTAFGGPIVMHLGRFVEHGGALLKVAGFFVVPAVIGLAVLVDAGRRGPCLSIRLRRGRRKVAFAAGTSVASAGAFCDVLESAGYRVLRNVVRG